MQEKGPRIITFYSYKGGTGRSMALANVAWILAANVARVLAIDWDLEAPGLHRYFRPFLIDPELFETDGLIDTFWDLATRAFGRASNYQRGTEDKESASRTDRANEDDIEDAFEDVTRRLESRKIPIDGLIDGIIDFICAGRQSASYSERVNTFDWKRFYEIGGAEMLQAVKAYTASRYDYVLIDSRTGVSDTSGVCTMQMPDTVVACFTLNRQSIDGVAAVLRSIRAYHSATVDGSAINFFPVAMRIEFSEHERLEIARGYARAALREFLPTEAQKQTRDYWDDMEVTYRPYYAYEEVLAAFGDSTGATGASNTLLSEMEVLARRISGNTTLRTPELVEADRAGVLAEYALGVQIAEQESESKPSPHLDEEDTQFLRSVYAKEQKWQKSGFFYGYLLNRRELGLLTQSDRARFGRHMAFYHANSILLQSFKHRFNRALFIIVGSPLAICLSLLFFEFRSAPSWVNWQELLFNSFPGIIVIYLIFFLLSWLVEGFILYRASDKPYGFSLSSVLVLSLVGPFQLDH